MQQAGQPCTVKEVAALAGVSTTTVSRVVNGFDTVSRDMRVKVSQAISRAQYCPNAHAAEMGRKSRGTQRTRGSSSCVPDDTEVKTVPAQRTGARVSQERPRVLEDENLRLKRLVASLSARLAVLRSLNE